MSLLKDKIGEPEILWDGTCAKFDMFYPLSQFAVEQRISESPVFSCKIRQPQKERLNQDFYRKIAEELLDDFLKSLKNKDEVSEPQPHPDSQVIPVHLKIKNPLQLSCFGFDFDYTLPGLVWAVNRMREKHSFFEQSDIKTDFIFRDTQNCPSDQVEKELKLGHLFSVDEDEAENRYRLSMQRFILFLEEKGYDGIQYDYRKEEVYTHHPDYKQDFDNRAYVIFRPEQVIRLDKQVDVPSTQSSKREKIELHKIYHRYVKNYQWSDVTLENDETGDEATNRVMWKECIKNKLHSR